MLRLILKNGNGKLFSEDPVNLADFRVFEIEHKEFEAFIAAQREANKPVSLLGIEVFVGAPKPVVAPLPALITVPLPNDATAQARLKEELKAKHRKQRRERWLMPWRRQSTTAISLPM